MKIEKNKIVFASIVICVMLFIGAYSMLVLKKEETDTIENKQVPVPELEDEQKVYDSKLDALNDLKEDRETNAPSIYDERLLNAEGVYDPDLLDKEKMRIVDSIYNEGRISYTDQNYRRTGQKAIKEVKKNKMSLDTVDPLIEQAVAMKEIGLEHQLFFASAPLKNEVVDAIKDTDALIYAAVNRTQVVKKDFRLELRLTQPAVVSGRKLPKHTRLYGFVSFKPNRVMLHITNIEQQKVSLKAYDMQDGNEGIYIVNNFRGEASNEIVEDAIDQINIPSVPSVGVFKKVFQRSNRNVKVTIIANYKLILKVSS